MANHTDAVLNAHQTVIEMFEERDKPHIANELRKYGRLEIKEILKTRNIFVFDVGTELRIVYCLESKFKLPEIKKYFEPNDEDNDDPFHFDSYILVLKDKPSTNNFKALHEIGNSLQIFELRELQFNIAKHVLVPKHRLIPSNDDSIPIIFQKLGIKSRSQLPVILKSDPMAKFLNAKTGDLVEITRYSPTSGEHTFYRICV